jgi:Flp pilus assembly protein TadG
MLRPPEKVRSQRGQAVVEFTLVALLFFTVLFSVVEFAHLFYVKLTLRQALGQAGRFMVTGRTLQDPLGTDIPRDQAIQQIFDKWLIGTGTGLQDFKMTCDGAGCDGGNSEETVVLTATFNKQLFMAYFAKLFPAIGGCPAGNVCFTMSTTWRNEPFPSS